MKREKRWVIVGRVGLYIGQMRTRKDAIAQHVYDLWSNQKGFEALHRFPNARGLTADQKRAWELCKRKGDRCVRASISY